MQPIGSLDRHIACVLQDGAIMLHSLTDDYQPIAGFNTPYYPHGHGANIKCITYSNRHQLLVTSTNGTLSVCKMVSSGII